MFFGRPGYDLAPAVPGTLAGAPKSAMIDALARDYANTRAMIFGEAPAFEEVLASPPGRSSGLSTTGPVRAGHRAL